MTDEVQVTSLQYARAFPWLRLGRALGCAIAPLPLGIAILASLTWSLLIVPIFSVQSNDFDGWVSKALVVSGADGLELQPSVSLAPPLAAVAPWPRSWFAWNTIRQLLGVLMGYALWTIAGVVIARATAVQMCRDEAPPLRETLKWGLRKLISGVGALLTSMGLIGLLACAVFLLALPGTVPALGVAWLQVIVPVQVMTAVALSALLLLLPVLWAMIVAALAADDSDSFDAFSRGFSLISTHPWLTFGLVVICFLITCVLANLAHLVIDFAGTSVFNLSATVFGPDREQLLLKLIPWWCGVFEAGFLSSLFWAHATIVYLFLRQAVDGTPLDALAGYELDTRFREPYPVVGMPAVKLADEQQP